jgi:fatty acid CoA ligase FadD9
VSRLRPIIEECEPTIVTVSAEYLDLAVESVLTSPSLRQLMVFDYRPEVDEQRENFESARARLQEAGAQVVVTTVDEVVERGSQLPAGPAYTEGSDERLAMIMYTSGSTGAPKGAMYTERTVTKVWTSGFFLTPGIPVLNVNFLPLNHLGGRLPLASALIAGGTNYFVPESDLSTLFADWALVRPTEMGVVPRVVEMLFQHYRSAVDRRIAEGADSADAEEDAAAELRERLLGGRVLGGFVGSAPLAGEMKTFLDSTLDVHIIDGYGLTETGILTRDGAISRKRVLDYKLIDVPELGYFLTDRPYPRGELLVKTDTMTPGYYKRPEITAQVFDEDGYYRTGDVMAEIKPDRLVYVDRRSNVLKLAQGEFVAVANLGARRFLGGSWAKAIEVASSSWCAIACRSTDQGCTRRRRAVEALRQTAVRARCPLLAGARRAGRSADAAARANRSARSGIEPAIRRSRRCAESCCRPGSASPRTHPGRHRRRTGSSRRKSDSRQ